MDTWELLRWSLGILTGDNHNSRYTRATVSLRPPVLSLPIPPLSARSSSTSSLSSTLRPFAPRACAYVCLCLPPPFPWPPLVASSPCRPRPPPPLVARSSCRVGHGYSAIVFKLSCSCCGCRCCGRLHVPPVTRGTLPGCPFLSPSFPPSPPRRPSLSTALLRRAPRFGIYFSTYVAPTYLSPSRPPFILEMGTGIHETKLMITTSKQRAARPTATCPSHPYISLFVPLPPSHPHRTVLRCSMRTPRVSLRPVSPVLPRFSFFSADSPLSR